MSTDESDLRQQQQQAEIYAYSEIIYKPTANFRENADTLALSWKRGKFPEVMFHIYTDMYYQRAMVFEQHISPDLAVGLHITHSTLT